MRRVFVKIMSGIQDKEIFIHEIFRPIEENFRFFFVGMNMMVMKDFQRVLVDHHKKERGMLELGLSVDFNGLPVIKYAAQSAIQDFNVRASVKFAGARVQADLSPLINWQARMMMVGISDITLYSKYHKYWVKEDIFRFVKHIRNGSAHNNSFYFEHCLDAPVIWRNKTIDNTLAGKEVFPSFITVADLVILMHDLSESINDK